MNWGVVEIHSPCPQCKWGPFSDPGHWCLQQFHLHQRPHHPRRWWQFNTQIQWSVNSGRHKFTKFSAANSPSPICALIFLFLSAFPCRFRCFCCTRASEAKNFTIHQINGAMCHEEPSGADPSALRTDKPSDTARSVPAGEMSSTWNCKSSKNWLNKALRLRSPKNWTMKLKTRGMGSVEGSPMGPTLWQSVE